MSIYLYQTLTMWTRRADIWRGRASNSRDCADICKVCVCRTGKEPNSENYKEEITAFTALWNYANIGSTFTKQQYRRHGLGINVLSHFVHKIIHENCLIHVYNSYSIKTNETFEFNYYTMKSAMLYLPIRNIHRLQSLRR